MVSRRGDGSRASVNDALERHVEKVVVKVGLDIVANLQEPATRGGTPIDTSFASANWTNSSGRPVPDVETPAEPTESDAASAAARTEAERARFLGYKLRDGLAFASNPTEYIGLLNAGSSPQAEAGFVERGIEKAVNQDIRQ